MKGIDAAKIHLGRRRKSAADYRKSPFHYTGRELDSETGLYYYRARYYDSDAGRFSSEDPLRFYAGRNFYLYGRNNPSSLTDPSGLETGNLNRLVPGPNGEVATNAPLSPNQAARISAYFRIIEPWHQDFWQNLTPWHGNWCGPNWSGGLHPSLYLGVDGAASAKDKLDELCRQHDFLYEHAKCDLDRLKADKWLLEQAQALPPDRSYDHYRKLLIIGFKTKIAWESGPRN